ncbi:NUDIX hydrolase domain-like protein, partial [Pilaira anomala]
ELDSDLVEESYTVTRYPLKVDKKPPRDEECAVSIVEKISPNQEPLYLISKRPETGLLAGLWEFPTLELDTLDSDYIERAKKSTQYLNTRYQLEFKQPNRFDLGNVVHLFSHIRKVYHIEWIQYEQDDLPTIDRVTDVKWVTLTELKTSPIPTGLKKALKLLENFKTTNSTTLTKKKAVKKSVKTTKSANIASFFKKE